MCQDMVAIKDKDKDNKARDATHGALMYDDTHGAAPDGVTSGAVESAEQVLGEEGARAHLGLYVTPVCRVSEFHVYSMLWYVGYQNFTYGILCDVIWTFLQPTYLEEAGRKTRTRKRSLC